MVAWAPRRPRGLLWRGASRAEIEAAYPGWTVIDDEESDVSDARF